MDSKRKKNSTDKKSNGHLGLDSMKLNPEFDGLDRNDVLQSIYQGVEVEKKDLKQVEEADKEKEQEWEFNMNYAQEW